MVAEITTFFGNVSILGMVQRLLVRFAMLAPLRSALDKLSKGPKQASDKSRAERKKNGCTNQAFFWQLKAPMHYI